MKGCVHIKDHVVCIYSVPERDSLLGGVDGEPGGQRKFIVRC